MGLSDDVRRTISGRSGLSVTELHALEHLSTDALGPAEIARLLDVSTAASTGIVDRLEAKGHVERRPHHTDRRRTEVVMTPSAYAEVMAQLAPMFGELARLDEGLSAAERAIVTGYLNAVIRAAATIVDAEPHTGTDESHATGA